MAYQYLKESIPLNVTGADMERIVLQHPEKLLQVAKKAASSYEPNRQLTAVLESLGDVAAQCRVLAQLPELLLQVFIYAVNIRDLSLVDGLLSAVSPKDKQRLLAYPLQRSGGTLLDLMVAGLCADRMPLATRRSEGALNFEQLRSLRLISCALYHGAELSANSLLSSIISRIGISLFLLFYIQSMARGEQSQQQHLRNIASDDLGCEQGLQLLSEYIKVADGSIDESLYSQLVEADNGDADGEVILVWNEFELVLHFYYRYSYHDLNNTEQQTVETLYQVHQLGGGAFGTLPKEILTVITKGTLEAADSECQWCYDPPFGHTGFTKYPYGLRYVDESQQQDVFDGLEATGTPEISGFG